MKYENDILKMHAAVQYHFDAHAYLVVILNTS